MNIPSIYTPNIGKPFQLHINASGTAVGACLSQVDKSGSKHPIAFYNKKLYLCQMKWSTIEQKAYSLLTSLQKFDTWVFGVERGVVSNHNPLTNLTKTIPQDAKLAQWALAFQRNFIRLQVVFANAMFQAVRYGPGEYQILSCGTDRKVTYYEVLDGTPVRSLEASLSGAINAMDVTDDAKVFVTGGADKLLKVWKYLEGIVTHVGIGHSDEITALRISPDNKYIVSVGKDGCIICWNFPV